MKKYILLFFITPASALLLSSCKKFLDVNPKTELPAEALFNTENGFKDALTGVYIQLHRDGAYGFSLSQGAIEYLTSSWDVTPESAEEKLGLFNYEDEQVRAFTDDIFNTLYKSIANINNILQNIDEKKSVFSSEDMYRIIKGEALGLRAYLHADILRMYGPVPNSAEAEKSRLPYVKEISKKPRLHISYEAYKTLLMKDISDATALLKDIDPILKYSLSQLKRPSAESRFDPKDNYTAYRYLRMNYYAIKALEARINLWYGDNTKAYEAAKEVISAANTSGEKKFRLGTSADLNAGNYVLTIEQIFGLYDFNMVDDYTTRYNEGMLKKGSNSNTISRQLYGNTGTDIRETDLWTLLTSMNKPTAYIIKKYIIPSSQLDLQQIPMLRISELYLIMAETAPLAEAQTLWNEFKASRNISTSTLPNDTKRRQVEIIKEYRKEFYAEGQSFCAYKRTNADKSTFLFLPANATIRYVLPMPMDETANIK